MTEFLRKRVFQTIKYMYFQVIVSGAGIIVLENKKKGKKEVKTIML